MPNKPLIILVATGLGRVNRGFEQYIHSLGNQLIQNQDLQDFKIKVYAGGYNKLKMPYEGRKIPCLKRDSFLSRVIRTSNKRLRFERFTFFLSMLPYLWLDKPKAIYLGEYPIYGWLFKVRKFGLINCNLALYTGGQAIPGKDHFDVRKDFIHHITDFYYDQCRIFPFSRQALLPHFINIDFEYSDSIIQQIIQQAKGKKIILSIGALEKSSKRMDLLIHALIPFKDKVFPVLLGEPTADKHELLQILLNNFGAGNFTVSQVPHKELGNYFQAADAFILCSPKESFGLVLIEALFHGLPVACYPFGESRFVMQHHAKWLSGKVSNTLSSEIEEWLSNLAAFKECSFPKHQFVMKNYSPQYLWPLYLEMFRKIIA
jgi:glycosyltransferase involved in cell wall biosynthesis